MVRGLLEFCRFFQDCKESFVILGGAACDEWFSQENFQFRTTKDIDLVIILEAQNQLFFSKLWEFLRLGGYKNWQRDDGEKTFFRFLEPEHANFPAMIELLARPDFSVEIPVNQKIIPIHLNDDISSLSAILLDDAYYRLILNNRQESANGLPVVTPQALILLKAKAYLNLLALRERGNFVKGDDLRKHRNDVFRLAYLLQTGSEADFDGIIKDDLKHFLQIFPPDSAEWKGIMDALRKSSLPNFSSEILLQRISTYFKI